MVTRPPRPPHPAATEPGGEPATASGVAASGVAAASARSNARTVLDAPEIARVLARLAHEIADRAARDARGPLRLDPARLALVGIRTGGAHLAVRLARELSALVGQPVEVGILDITLYRDDVMMPGHGAPVLRGTEIDFDVDGRVVVLVDDVLFTGRTVRAALDALLDLGRPACVRLAVLIDRGLRELPVAADFIGRALETEKSERVDVLLTESGASADAVRVLSAGDIRG